MRESNIKRFPAPHIKSAGFPSPSFTSLLVPNSSHLPFYHHRDDTLSSAGGIHARPSVSSLPNTTHRPRRTTPKGHPRDHESQTDRGHMRCVSPWLDSHPIFFVLLTAHSCTPRTGAGISVRAGIPDFRSSEGLFQTLKRDNPREALSSGKDLFDASVFNVSKRFSHARTTSPLFLPPPPSGRHGLSTTHSAPLWFTDRYMTPGRVADKQKSMWGGFHTVRTHYLPVLPDDSPAVRSLQSSGANGVPPAFADTRRSRSALAGLHAEHRCH